jgi:arsenate reductase (thioredoxin)
MYRVLLLCKNNAVLSPMAEGYFKSFQTEDAEIYRAGLIKDKLDPLAYKIMKEDDIDISTLGSHTISEYRHLSFDYILTFDDDSKSESLHFPSHSVKYHFDFDKLLPGNSEEIDKTEVYRSIREKIKKIIKAFIKDHFAKADVHH